MDSLVRDVLNDLLFERFNADVYTVLWLGGSRWLIHDCEQPQSFTVELKPVHWT